MSIPRFYDADRLHEMDSEIRRRVLTGLDAQGDVLVHFDPCRPRHCPGCALEACRVRAAAFTERAPLTLASATRGEEELETGEPVHGVAS